MHSCDQPPYLFIEKKEKKKKKKVFALKKSSLPQDRFGTPTWHAFID